MAAAAATDTHGSERPTASGLNEGTVPATVVFYCLAVYLYFFRHHGKLIAKQQQQYACSSSNSNHSCFRIRPASDVEYPAALSCWLAVSSWLVRRIATS